jgi:hypothetical protein
MLIRFLGYLGSATWQVAFLYFDVSQNAGGRREDFRVHFVRGNFKQRLVGWTFSPTFFSHLVIVPSKIDSPICGITTSTPAPPMDINSTFLDSAFLS